MSVQQRPIDLITRTHGMLGTPFVEWGFSLAAGGFGSYRELGITEGAEIAQTVSHADMRDPRSGTSQLVRRHTREFDLQLNVQTKKFDAANLQLMLLASGITTVTAGLQAVVDEVVFLTDDEDDFVDLANSSIVESSMGVTPAPITLEAVGTGQGGTFGEVQGDFALDFAINVVANVSLFRTTTLAGVVTNFTVVNVAPATGEVEIEEGAAATSGEITFFGGEAPAVGDVIEATYESTLTITDNTDVFYDPKFGRVRCLFSTDKLRPNQPIEVTYNYNALDHERISPGTQLTFPGRCRIRHLPDAGVNWIWEIPQCSIQASGDAFSFTADEWNTHTIQITLENDGTSDPYGVNQIYDETLTEAA